MARGSISGYVEQGGHTVITGGQLSTTDVQESFPGSTVSVYLTGTTTLATIYSDSGGTAKGNPFTAGTDASFSFWTNSSTVDIKFSGTGITTPFTISSIVPSISSLSLPFINVMDTPYNAICDGVSDDSAAVQAALTALASTGGTIQFPTGKTCRLTSLVGPSDSNDASLVGLNSVTAGTSFKIIGNGSTIITSVNSGTALASIDTLYFAGNSSLEISGITFKYDGAATTKFIIGVHMYTSATQPTTLDVHDCKFYNYYEGIRINGSIPSANTAVGLAAQITNNQFYLQAGLSAIYSGALSSPATGIFVNTAQQVIATGNFYDGCVDNSGSPALWGDGLINTYANGNTISNNTIVNYGIEGIFIVRYSGYDINYPHVISGNTIRNGKPTSVGIRCDEPNAVITGNSIVDTQYGIILYLEDVDIFAGYRSTGSIVSNNNITMRSDYVSDTSTGIFIRQSNVIVEGNLIRWPSNMTGYGAVISKGISLSSNAYNISIKNNVMVNMYHRLSLNAVVGTLAVGDTVVGNSSNTGANIQSASIAGGGTGTILLGPISHSNHQSYGNYLVGEGVTITGGKTAVIASVDYPVANTYGIWLDQTCPTYIDGNRTENLDRSIYLATNAATKNGPINIQWHDSSFLDKTRLEVQPTDEFPNNRMVWRKQEMLWIPSGAAAWYRIMEADGYLGGRYTIVYGTQIIVGFDVSYDSAVGGVRKVTITQPAALTGALVDNIRVGVVAGTEIALDLHVSGTANASPLWVEYQTDQSNNFLGFDVTTRKTLAPTSGVAEPGTRLITTSFLSAGVGAVIASTAGVISPTASAQHVSGVNAITGITALGFSDGETWTVIPDGAFTWTNATNIAVAGTAVVNKLLVFTWDATAARWYPSYV